MTNLPLRDADIPPAIGQEPVKKPWTSAFFRAQIRAAIRSVYFKWPMRKAVLQAAREIVMVPTADGKRLKKQTWFRCNGCQILGKETLGKADAAAIKEWRAECAAAKKADQPLPPRPDVPYRIWCDHIDPVVSLEGDYPDWHTYIFRHFVDMSQMQALCDICHSLKSKSENAIRKQNVKERNMVGWNVDPQSTDTGSDSE